MHKEKADNKSETLNVLIEEVKGTQPNIDGGLDGTIFSKKEKEAIRQALDAMYHLYDASSDRNELIARVLKKLQRDNKG